MLYAGMHKCPDQRTLVFCAFVMKRRKAVCALIISSVTGSESRPWEWEPSSMIRLTGRSLSTTGHEMRVFASRRSPLSTVFKSPPVWQPKARIHIASPVAQANEFVYRYSPIGQNTVTDRLHQRDPRSILRLKSLIRLTSCRHCLQEV